jgi:hypothetical protein
LKITLEDNSCLILTLDHKILNENKEFVNAENLKIGDYVCCKGNMNGNTTNDTLQNLEICTKEEHAKLHSNNIINHIQYIQKNKIIRIEKHNEVMTYDISVESPNNNFSANNIIVHNCDNSIAHLLSVAGYEVKNPSRTLKTFHFHITNIRNYTNISGQAINVIPPPYKLLPPTL